MQQNKDMQEENKPVTAEQDKRALESNAGMDAQKIAAAHEQADKDMEDDKEFTASSPNDDLDEGETARLGEEKTDLI